MSGFPEIVRRAMVDTVSDIGQLSYSEKRQLSKAVRQGYLSKGKGGPYPAIKTVYAVAGFDFAADRCCPNLKSKGFNQCL